MSEKIIKDYVQPPMKSLQDTHSFIQLHQMRIIASLDADITDEQRKEIMDFAEKIDTAKEVIEAFISS